MVRYAIPKDTDVIEPLRNFISRRFSLLDSREFGKRTTQRAIPKRLLIARAEHRRPDSEAQLSNNVWGVLSLTQLSQPFVGIVNVALKPEPLKIGIVMPGGPKVCNKLGVTRVSQSDLDALQRDVKLGAHNGVPLVKLKRKSTIGSGGLEVRRESVD